MLATVKGPSAVSAMPSRIELSELIRSGSVGMATMPAGIAISSQMHNSIVFTDVVNRL